MSAAELEAEGGANSEQQQQQQPQQQQQTPQQYQHQQQQQQQQQQHQPNEHLSTAIEETLATSSNNNNSYNNNIMVEEQLQLNNMLQHAQQQQQQQQQQQLETNNDLTGLGLSLMQSSPPPHSYRHSRAYRHFKNPPQPHMCIRTTTETGEELFINVLSWTRIVIPQEPSDPIPLYGGMRVPPGSPRSPPIVFAVMANPEVLKDSGRHSKDPEERRAMVELMCDFVEAMNPGVKLVRNAVILKDRDISGELKDVWNAVQAQRDREREEQMLQQRQQQHYQNITTQQMFPKSPDAARAASGGGGAGPGQLTEGGNSLQTASIAESVPGDGQANDNGVTLAVFAQQLDNKVASEQIEQQQQQQKSSEDSSNDSCVDQTDNGGASMDKTNGSLENADALEMEMKASINCNGGGGNGSIQPPLATVATPVVTPNPQSSPAPSAPLPAQIPVAVVPAPASAPAATPASAPVPVPTPAPAPAPAPAKKEKLGGFLPNGCIFPRFKNNKHKDKDSSNHKETKSKEKTLLNALKKSKEKKVAPSEQQQQQQQQQSATNNGDKASTTEATSQYEKNCINNLECEVQKLDLNNSNNDNNMFIKLKVSTAQATPAAAAK